MLLAWPDSEIKLTAYMTWETERKHGHDFYNGVKPTELDIPTLKYRWDKQLRFKYTEITTCTV